MQVLEVSGEFVVSEDMYAVIAGKARNRLGMGLWATCHVSNLIIEGKVGLQRVVSVPDVRGSGKNRTKKKKKKY